jgi:16S rRNA (guanine527-N7)-methyltransferase
MIKVSRETSELLSKYIDQILIWNKRINLISRKSESREFLERQVQDCMQLYELMYFKEGPLIDVGTGSGLPGVVLSLMGMTNCNLVDVNHKKTTFLTSLKNELNATFNVHNLSIEELKLPVKAKYITSKAYGSLDLMIKQCWHLMDDQSELITLKSAAQLEDELKKLSMVWQYDLKLVDNQYNNGYIVQLKNIRKGHV